MTALSSGQIATRRARADLRALALGLVLVLVWDAAGLDLAVSARFGGPGGFAWKEHWITATLLHQGGRAMAWMVLAFLAVNVLHPLVAGLTRAERLRWLLVTTLCVVAVPALKLNSSTSCPWDLAQFGGTAMYLPHWVPGASDGGPGHCFPSGHAVSAFGFLPGWYALRRRRPRLARAWLGVVVGLGILFGGAQLVRGAHYVSHILWSAWLCWGLSLWGHLPDRPAALAGTLAPVGRRG